ncbi:MAG: STAS domain-containing protein [Devosia sp.]
MATMPQIPLALPAVMDLDALDGVRDGLLAAMERGAVVVSGAAVERISTNGLLLLLSAAETARAGNSSLTIEAVSKPLYLAIERLGFERRFSDLVRD